MSYTQHWFLCLFLIIRTNRSSLVASLLGGIHPAFADRSTLVCPWVGVHRRTLLERVRVLSVYEEIASSWLKHVLSELAYTQMPLAACSSLSSRDLASASLLVRRARSSLLSASEIVSAGYRLLCILLVGDHFLSIDLLTFIERNLGRLIIEMVLMNPLEGVRAKILRQHSGLYVSQGHSIPYTEELWSK